MSEYITIARPYAKAVFDLAKNSKFHKYNPIQENPSEKNINSYYEKNS